ncbi:hypothetical protein PM082_009309 [Marasmius tenuissimus]|nr:hypothetical protein PM082_009309 [Marasmius tenuissimus]
MSSDRNDEIARQAEADLNSYQAKTGTGQKGLKTASDAPGVDSNVEKKFSGAQVVTGDDSSTVITSGFRRMKENDKDIVADSVPVKDRSGLPGIAAEGNEASIHNVGRNPPGPGGSQYKGADYCRSEVVPDSIAAEGNIPPSSITQASRETEGYDAEGRS